MDKIGILDKFSFYRGATPPVRGKIAEAGTYAALAPGTTFFSESERCEYFGIVGRGDIRVFKAAESGREMTLYHVQDGELCLVNMLSLFLDREAMASAVVEVSTEAVVFDAPAFRDLFENQGVVRSFVFEAMAQRLVEVMTLIEEIAFAKMDRRVAGLLLKRFSSHRGFTVTHEELAIELGTAREVVSRLLKEFERTGAIAMARGRLELRNGSFLREVAGRS